MVNDGNWFQKSHKCIWLETCNINIKKKHRDLWIHIMETWATVSSWSCFCWLCRASPSLAAKNIINLISVSTIWWCPCVESSLVWLEDGVCYDQCVLLANSASLCPASFCTPRPNMSVTPGVSWLPTFAFQSPIMKRTSFLGVSSRRYYTSS